jgi:hypothetical protein
MKKQEFKNIERIVERAAKRSSSSKDIEYIKYLLRELVNNHSIPIDLLNEIPVKAKKIGKTRFDQIYDAYMALMFPNYTESTLERLLGYFKEDNEDIKIWRVILPERFRISQILLRAKSFQEAFALACDYICRTSMWLYHEIPSDITIRIIYMTESALRRFLGIRAMNRRSKRKKFQFKSREFTPKQIQGAVYAGLSPSSSQYSIMKYVEKKDLKIISKSVNRKRISAVESESKRRL